MTVDRRQTLDRMQACAWGAKPSPHYAHDRGTLGELARREDAEVMRLPGLPADATSRTSLAS